MNWMRQSITRMVGLTFLALIFTLFLVYYFVFNVQMKGSMEQQSKEQLLKDSGYIATEIEMFLQKYILIVEQASNNPDFINIADNVKDRYKKREDSLYQKVTKQLVDIHNLDKNISLSYIALSRANDLITNIYDYDTNSSYDLNKREWYATTIKNSNITVTKPYLDLVTNEMIITIAKPIFNKQDLVGVFALDISIKNIRDILNSFQVGKNGYPVLLYKSGELLFHPDFDTTNTNHGLYIQDILGDKATEFLSGSGVSAYSYLGEEKFIAYLPIENSDLIVFTIIPQKEVFYQVTKLSTINLVVFLVFIALTALVLYFFKRYIAEPVIKISREIENYSSNTTIMMPHKYLKRKDEIGILSIGLSEMTDKISNYLLEIEEKNVELSHAKEEISIERSIFKTTLHSLGDGVISTGKEGTVDLMNAVAEN